MNLYLDTTDLDPDNETVVGDPDCPLCRTSKRPRLPLETIVGWSIVAMGLAYILLAVWIEFDLFRNY